jgi:uncharacterized protein Usg
MRWEDNIKINLREYVWNWMELAQDHVRWRAFCPLEHWDYEFEYHLRHVAYVCLRLSLSVLSCVDSCLVSG